MTTATAASTARKEKAAMIPICQPLRGHLPQSLGHVSQVSPSASLHRSSPHTAQREIVSSSSPHSSICQYEVITDSGLVI
ncbi:hypothetical protein DPMN_082946 [Dreissena polymorpha]|uniref:Uncharacterized protein n=1 Tax=Dreissena polymorpha TaxID=45954 RepID=A0A9D3YAY9_DREPO|nr:hypothetical protein DPMN_082946 [Dreissena polymorpha]